MQQASSGIMYGLGRSPDFAGGIAAGKLKYILSIIHTMSDVTDGWPVWIPLIVGLTPGLVYWLAITARRSK